MSVVKGKCHVESHLSTGVATYSLSNVNLPEWSLGDSNYHHGMNDVLAHRLNPFIFLVMVYMEHLGYLKPATIDVYGDRT